MKIAAVIVTHNRLAFLQQCLEAVEQQSLRPQQIIVVDNESTDGTRQWLASRPGLTVISQANSGSAGGQNRGLREAIAHGHDFVWCMDDDTLPTPTALEKLVAAAESLSGDFGFLCSKVLWRDGTVHQLNKPCFASAEEPPASEALRPVSSATFVSILFSREAILRRGLPIRDFHIWLDDTEYTQRISRTMPSFFVHQSLVTHCTATNSAADLSKGQGWNSWKTAHAIRNLAYLQKWAPDGHPGKPGGGRGPRTRAFFRVARLAFIHTSPPYALLYAWQSFVGAFLFRPKLDLGSDFTPPGNASS